MTTYPRGISNNEISEFLFSRNEEHTYYPLIGINDMFSLLFSRISKEKHLDYALIGNKYYSESKYFKYQVLLALLRNTKYSSVNYFINNDAEIKDIDEKHNVDRNEKMYI